METFLKFNILLYIYIFTNIKSFYKIFQNLNQIKENNEKSMKFSNENINVLII